MFCPNCGNDCGNTRFCSSCGTQLQQAAAPATQSGEWKVGIPCPNCGATQLDGQKCAFCGSQLVVNQNSSEDNATPIPYGFYKGAGSSLDLREDHLVIGKTYSFPICRKIKSCVSYSELKKVMLYKGGTGLFDIGFLSIRWGDNIHIPTPNSELEARGDVATIEFGNVNVEVFEKIYRALKAMIDNRERE